MSSDYRVFPFPRERRIVVDAQHFGAGRHLMQFLLEVDISEALEVLEVRREGGERLSLTAWLIACLGRAIAENPEVHACLDWRGRLVQFSEVDVCTMVEISTQNGTFPIAHVLRNTHERDVADLSRELHHVKRDPAFSPDMRWWVRARWLFALPRPVRLLMFRFLTTSPWRLKHIAGTAVVTSIPVRGHRAFGFGLLGLHNLGLAVGGLVDVPVAREGRIEARRHVCLTFGIDHDVVDGAPAVRFLRHFVALLEKAAHLPATPRPDE